MSKFAGKSFRIIMGMLVIYAGLVATHKGEFWPFSIYPMFSQAGRPWTRALVQDVTETPDSLIWETTDMERMHGSVVTLKNTGVEQIDFANFVSKTKDWDTRRKRVLVQLFNSSKAPQSRWMVTKVRGRLTESDSVVVKAVPFLMITRDSVYVNPRFPDQYNLLD